MRPQERPRIGPVAAAAMIGGLLRWRPEGRASPGHAERRRFADLERRHAEVGVDLLDWFVMTRAGPAGGAGGLRLVSVHDVGSERR
jgi:hypothetical protein